MRLAVFGLGYVGSVTAACLADDGHQVVGVDTNPQKIETFNAGRGPIREPGLDDLIHSGIES
jgi:GDP-mannose 6-dehydrogenase